MKRPVIHALLAFVAVCALVFALQTRQIRSLESRVVTLRETPAESAQESPSGENSATSPAARSRPGPARPASAAPASEEKLDLVAETIKQRIADLGDIESGVVAFLRLLPVLFTHVESLELDELIAVADRLGNGELFPPSDGKSSARLVLYLLAAEQDPLKVLSRVDLELASNAGNLQTSILTMLARKDPDAAIRWLDSQSMDEGRKSVFQSGIALGLLAHAPRRGLDFILENPDSISRSGMHSPIVGFRISDSARDELIEALPDPRYAELRPTLSTMVLESSLATARVAELRAQTTVFQLGDQQVATFLRDHASQLMERDPDAAATWMKDALPADQYPSFLSTAIRRWTERDFNGAATFLGTMERGPARDQSIKEFADVVASLEPESAAQWALEIGDPGLRQSALHDVSESWLHLDPDAARGWLQKQGIPIPKPAQPKTKSP